MAVYHVFMLVWGERFVRDFVEVALPLQCMDGNLPTLAEQGEVYYHIYTDRTSLEAFKPEIEILKKFSNLKYHLIDEIRVGKQKLFERVRNLSGPAVKYEIQHHSFLDLSELALADKESIIIILDSNFLLSNGTLAAASKQICGGANAVNINALRVESTSVLPLLKNDLTVNPRTLVQLGLDHLHHIQKAFFIDAKPFTAYPSQLNWRVGEEGILSRAFIPHPLLIKATPKIRTCQSAMDYDLVLRSWPDSDIYMCGDSDEMLVLKHSEAAHHAERKSQIIPSPRDIAMFLITATHKRHRIFSDVSVYYHMNEVNSIWEQPINEAEQLLTDVYRDIDRIIAQTGNLDAKFLMLLKSYIGPIENYMSPGLEPHAMERL